MSAGLRSGRGARGLAALTGMLLLLAGLQGVAPAAAETPVPPFTGWVVDAVGALTDAERAALEARLSAHEKEKGAQVAVLLVDSTAGEAIEAYALRVVETWKLGRKEVDDGALLLVAVQDRALRIEVGYGLEGALTDATSKRIIDETIVPHFRSGNLYAGINAGVERMLAVIGGEALPPPSVAKAPGDALNLALFFAFFFSMMLQGLRVRGVRIPLAAAASGTVTLLVTGLAFAAGLSAVAAVILSALFGGAGGGPGRWVSHRRHGDRFPGGWGGSGSFGGSGGFGGGGGGSFGGGGASGRW